MPDLPVDPLLRQAVVDLLARYATGIDSRDWALLRSCFSDDCDADYGDIGHWRSGDEITTWMAETHEPLGPTQHRISNVVLRHDGTVLQSRCAVHAVVVLPDRSAAVHAYGFYEDEIVSVGDPKIARRRFTQVTSEVHAAIS
jgi:3-phenylpropionate/cinnamic acid dioxygenase small subunit